MREKDDSFSSQRMVSQTPQSGAFAVQRMAFDGGSFRVSVCGMEDFMAKGTERNTHKIEAGNSLGEVQIADEVVAMIAGLAATEVEGVASMAGNITSDVISKLGMKNLSKGVKVDMGETVRVALALNLAYGYNIPDTSEKVQTKVKNAIENMTGLTVSDVNIRIASVDMKTEE